MIRSSVARILEWLEEWTLYPMIFLWIAALSRGLYMAYKYIDNI
jgi:hypothetical protein